MNIKIPKEIADVLLTKTLHTIEFGNVKGEDTDLLHIVVPNHQMDISSVDNNHTLFYKDEENKTDHLFITPRGFLQGIVTGSNTLFFEVLCDGLLRGTCLEFLEQYTTDFMTYKLMKAFIGCSERDFTQAKKHKEPEKKLKWSLEYVNMVSRSLGKSSVDLTLLNREYIRYIRDELNSDYEKGEILFSLPVEQYTEITSVLNFIKKCNINEVNLEQYYYNTWSENK